MSIATFSCVHTSFLIVHLGILHCTWQETPPAIAVMPIFFARMTFWAKREEKKMFCDKIVFVHLCICIYMYTNIRIRIITLLFNHSHVNIVLFNAEDTFSRSYCVPFFFFFPAKTIFEPKAKEKKNYDFERKQIVPILLCMYIDIHMCIVIFSFLTIHV